VGLWNTDSPRPGKLSAAGAMFPMHGRILPPGLVQIVELFELYCDSGLRKLQTGLGCDLLSQAKALGVVKSPRRYANFNEKGEPYFRSSGFEWQE